MDQPETLVAAAVRGDYAASRRLTESAWPQLYRIAYGVTQDRADAEDAAQEACALILKSISALRRPAAFKTWATRIVLREARRAMRHECSRLPPEGRFEQDTVLDSIDIARALSALPMHEREVTVLRYFADLSSREIAAVLGVPRGTVRFRLLLARRHLRVLLDVGDEARVPRSSQETTRDTV